MSLAAQTSRAVAHAEIPFDKLRYSVQVNTSIDVAGRLRASGVLTLRAARVLPPPEGQTEERWEDDPSRPAVVRVLPDVFALAAQMPTVASAIAALHAAVGAYNTTNQLV